LRRFRLTIIEIAWHSFLSKEDSAGPLLSKFKSGPFPELHLPQSFFARPAEQVAPELIGCLLVKCQADGELLWGVIVETEAYEQDASAIYVHCFGISCELLFNC
jgi:hypothetical protein